MASFNFEEFAKTMREIDRQNKKLDADIEQVEAQVEEKNKIVQAYDEKINNLRKQIFQVKLQSQSLVNQRFQIQMNKQDKYKEMDEYIQEIVDCETEIEKQEILTEYWQNRKFDEMDSNRRQLNRTRDEIDHGRQGQKLAQLQQKLKNVKSFLAANDWQTLRKEEQDFQRDMVLLNSHGQKLEQESMMKSKELSKMEAEIDNFKVKIRSKRNFLTAKRIREKKKKEQNEQNSSQYSYS